MPKSETRNQSKRNRNILKNRNPEMKQINRGRW